ncbi:MAG: hypothetical protein ACOZDD_00555 [Bacteroidota bacterium]
MRINAWFLLDIPLSAVEVRGPDGYALLVVIVILLVVPSLYFLIRFLRNKKTGTRKRGPLFGRKKISIVLEKDRKYYPDIIRVVIKNTGSRDIDLSRPLLIFRNFWTKRKFRLKGTTRYSFYPLLLEPGKEHDLTIDLNHFYRHDKRLKRYPKMTIIVSDESGKTFPSQSIMLRKTLFR